MSEDEKYLDQITVQYDRAMQEDMAGHYLLCRNRLVALTVSISSMPGGRATRNVSIELTFLSQRCNALRLLAKTVNEEGTA